MRATTSSTPATASPSFRWRSRCSPATTISTVVIYADKTRHWWEHARSPATASSGWRWARVQHVRDDRPRPRRTGINVMTRLMGLILAARSGDGRRPGQTVSVAQPDPAPRAGEPGAAAGATPAGRSIRAGGDPDRETAADRRALSLQDSGRHACTGSSSKPRPWPIARLPAHSTLRPSPAKPGRSARPAGGAVVSSPAAPVVVPGGSAA